MKKWYKSLTVQTGLAVIAWSLLPLAIEILNYIGSFDFESGKTNWFLFASGILMLVNRWRTDQPITSVNPAFDKFRPRIKKKLENNFYSELTK